MYLKKILLVFGIILLISLVSADTRVDDSFCGDMSDAGCGSGYIPACYREDGTGYYYYICILDTSQDCSDDPRYSLDCSKWCNEGWVYDYLTGVCCPYEYPYYGNDNLCYKIPKSTTDNYYTRNSECFGIENKCEGSIYFICENTIEHIYLWKSLGEVDGRCGVGSSYIKSCSGVWNTQVCGGVCDCAADGDWETSSANQPGSVAEIIKCFDTIGFLNARVSLHSKFGWTSSYYGSQCNVFINKNGGSYSSLELPGFWGGFSGNTLFPGYVGETTLPLTQEYSQTNEICIKVRLNSDGAHIVYYLNEMELIFDIIECEENSDCEVGYLCSSNNKCVPEEDFIVIDSCENDSIIKVLDNYYLCRDNIWISVSDLITPEEQEEILNLINQLQLTIEEKAALIESLTQELNEQVLLIEGLELTITEKALIIQQLTDNINEQNALIEQLELNLQEKIALVQALELNIQEQAATILALTSQVNEQAQIIINLNLNIQQQAQIISEMELTVFQQAIIIDNLNLNIQQQADIINNLNLNLQQKIELISQLEITTQEQADLIAQMGLSFTEQQEIINALNVVIEDDVAQILALQLSLSESAVYINDLEYTIFQQADLISQLELTNQEQANLISQLQLNNEETAQLIANLNLQISEQANIITNLQLTIDDDAEIITNLNLKLSEEADLINSLYLTINDQIELISQLELSIAEERELVSQLNLTIQEQQEILDALQGEGVLSFDLEQVMFKLGDFEVTLLMLLIAMGGFMFLVIIGGGGRR